MPRTTATTSGRMKVLKVEKAVYATTAMATMPTMAQARIPALRSIRSRCASKSTGLRCSLNEAPPVVAWRQW